MKARDHNVLVRERRRASFEVMNDMFAHTVIAAPRVRCEDGLLNLLVQ